MIRRWVDDGWRKRFAILPITLSDGPNKTMIWLQWVWVRDQAIYRQVSITDPAQAIEAGTAKTEGLGAKHESAVEDAPERSRDG